MTYYLDSSALVKRYVREAGTTTVRRLLASGMVATSRLTDVEVSSAIARRAREGVLSQQQRDRLLTALHADLSGLAVVELTPEIAADARALLLRHPLRASDSIQLASCLYLQRHLADVVPFVGFDDRLIAAARAEGLKVAGSKTRRRR